MTRIALLLALLSVCPAALPAAPLIHLPQGDFSCAVDVTTHAGPKSAGKTTELRYAPVLKKVNVIQIGKVRHDTNLWSDNSVSDLWNFLDAGVSILQSNTGKKDLDVLRGPLRDAASPKLLHFDAASVSWISISSRDKDSAAGKAIHYRAKVTLEGGDPHLPPPTAIYQAWIDSKTLLPLKFDDGDALYVLTFSPNPPARPLAVPPKIQAEFVRWQAASAPHSHL